MGPVDNSLVSHGIDFLRFVDDIIVFGKSERECRKRLYEVADILDKQQRLILNPAKTKLTATDWLMEHCRGMIEDRPINDLEDHLLSIIRKHSKGNPYKAVLLSEINPEDLASSVRMRWPKF
jgi:retron-type reverse transcriptase